MGEDWARIALAVLAVAVVAVLVLLWQPWNQPFAISSSASPTPQGIPGVAPSSVPSAVPGPSPSTISNPSSSPSAAGANQSVPGGARCIRPGLSEPQCGTGSQLVKTIGSDGCVSNYSCAPSKDLLVSELGQMQLPGCTSDAAFADRVLECIGRPNSTFSFIRDTNGCILAVNCTAIG